MPTLKIQGKEYTLRTPGGKEYMSVGLAEKGNVALARVTVLQQDFLEALFVGEPGEKEEAFHKAWLDFLAMIFVEPTDSLEYDTLDESEVEEIRDFFLLALARAAPKLKKRIEDFRASSLGQSPSVESPQATS